LAHGLGIDLSKPSELCHYGEPGKDCPTGGWFHLVGTILSGKDAWVQTSNTAWVADFEPDFDLPGVGFTSRIALLPDAFKGHPVVQLDFDTVVPWVLEG
jgi:hypothetical protein